MTFTVGETVVYPNHGAAVIEDIETRQIKGEDKLYLVLRIVGQTDLSSEYLRATWTWSASAMSWTLTVWSGSSASCGHRIPRSRPTGRADTRPIWRSCTPATCMKVAEVVRDLWRRERERGLSAGEKRMLAKARQILVSELALAERVEEDKAEILLDEVLAS